MVAPSRRAPTGIGLVRGVYSGNIPVYICIAIFYVSHYATHLYIHKILFTLCLISIDNFYQRHKKILVNS